MPLASDAQRLQQLHEQLDQALQRGDWQAIATVDAAIAQCLRALAEIGQPDPATLAARAALKQLHDQARVACAEECERLRQLLVNHLEYAEGLAAYQRVELFHTGEAR
ncbi:hypothetical protein NAV28_17755 [Pseudomonas stutzeri]|nr:hypothetical protein [Stutzerimonas degradans]